MSHRVEFNSNLDLILERTIDVPRNLIWQAWTTPAHLKNWFVPVPWKITECEIDLKPGGIFRTVMKSPEGNLIDNTGCFLEIVEQELLIWTDALHPGFRPKEDVFMTARLILESMGEETKYTAIATHKNEADKEKHQEMGFSQGWGIVADQLTEYIKNHLI